MLFPSIFFRFSITIFSYARFFLILKHEAHEHDHEYMTICQEDIN